MAEDRIVKITNIGSTDLPEHSPGADGCGGRGCSGCEVPTWNRIEFPLEKGQTIPVKENVGTHLVSKFRGKIQITGGPWDVQAILSSPDGLFEYDPVTGKYKPLDTSKLNTDPTGGPQDRNAEGETLADVKRKDRFLAKGGT